MDRRKIACGWAINHGTTSCAGCFDLGECMMLSALEEARELVRKACTIQGHPGSPVKYGEFDDTDPIGNYILPETLPNIPKLEADLGAAQWERDDLSKTLIRVRKENAAVREAIEEMALTEGVEEMISILKAKREESV